MIVVDTSVWIDWFAGRTTPQTKLLTLLVEDDASIALTDVVLTEILQGLRTEREARRVDEVLSSYEILRLEPLADHRHAALMFRQCRRAGVTIRSTIDCLIAAVCIREHVAILHNDVNFERLAEHTDLRLVAT